MHYNAKSQRVFVIMHHGSVSVSVCFSASMFCLPACLSVCVCLHACPSVCQPVPACVPAYLLSRRPACITRPYYNCKNCNAQLRLFNTGHQGPGHNPIALGLDLRQASMGPDQDLYVGDPHNVPNNRHLSRMSSMQQQVCCFADLERISCLKTLQCSNSFSCHLATVMNLCLTPREGSNPHNLPAI